MHTVLKKILNADSVETLQAILSVEKNMEMEYSLRRYLLAHGKKCYITSQIDGGEGLGIRVFMSKNGVNNETMEYFCREDTQYSCDLYGESTSIIECSSCCTLVVPEKLPENYLMVYFDRRYIVVNLNTKIED